MNANYKAVVIEIEKGDGENWFGKLLDGDTGRLIESANGVGNDEKILWGQDIVTRYHGQDTGNPGQVYQIHFGSMGV